MTPLSPEEAAWFRETVSKPDAYARLLAFVSAADRDAKPDTAILAAARDALDRLRAARA